MPVVYGFVAVALVIAVVAVAYGTQAPQLGVAEFAPAARQAVEPPLTTASDAGSPAAGGGSRRSPTTLPATTTTVAAGGSGSASAPTTRIARGRSCVGNPPRQTEDPQSPPCVTAIFESDNGGATATGVTATEIGIAIPNATQDAKDMTAAYFEYVNQRYEFYGRRLVPAFPTGGTGDPVQARQLAVDVASQQVFAALSAQVNYGSPPQAYLSESARQHVVTVSLDRVSMVADSTIFDSLHPYAWSVFPSLEQRYRAMTDLVCRSLAGKVARHAGAADLRGTTRRFAIVAMANHAIPSTTALEAGLGGCAELGTTIKLQARGLAVGALRTALASLKSKGVTSVVCVCGDASFPGSFLSEAVAAGYFPEWLPLYSQAAEEFYSNFVSPRSDGDQLANLVLMTPNHKSTPLQARPSFQAMVATRPDLVTKLGTGVTVFGDFIYKELAVLAAGIQAAGPTLTPESFAQGLMGMQFPNPGAGQVPYWQQSVGFGSGDHSFYNDFVVGWWNRQAPVVDPNAPVDGGSWCYVNQGARYEAGTFPPDVDSMLFDKSRPCR